MIRLLRYLRKIGRNQERALWHCATFPLSRKMTQPRTEPLILFRIVLTTMKLTTTLEMHQCQNILVLRLHKEPNDRAD